MAPGTCYPRLRGAGVLSVFPISEARVKISLSLRQPNDVERLITSRNRIKRPEGRGTISNLPKT